MNEVVGVDTSCLVAFAVGEHPQHEQVRIRWSTLAQEGCRLGLTPLALSEFVHVVTDAKRFQQPCSVLRALDFVEAWWPAPEVEHVFPTAPSLELSWKWMRQFQLGRKRVLDTQLASIFFERGIRKVFTINPRDFEIFSVFEILGLDSDPPEKSE